MTDRIYEIMSRFEVPPSNEIKLRYVYQKQKDIRTKGKLTKVE